MDAIAIVNYTYTGLDDIPEDATHVTIHESITVIPARLFDGHQNIVELKCHEGVIKIEAYACHQCDSLKRVIMLGAEIIETSAFHFCAVLEYVKCPKLEIIHGNAFSDCYSLTSIDLISVKIVEKNAFHYCEQLMKALFGNNLESIGGSAFCHCYSLERIQMPLKRNIITEEDVFSGCENLMELESVRGDLQHDIAALLLEAWRNDINREINTINRVLPSVTGGGDYIPPSLADQTTGEKALVIRWWLLSVCDKFERYKAEHRRILNQAAIELEHALPTDIIRKNVLTFVELPSLMKEGNRKRKRHEEG